MTLEGWTISKHMCAGLIPGVNIKTRPRVFFIFMSEAINDAVFKITSSLASSPNADTVKMHDRLYDIAIPPLSAGSGSDAETKRLFALYDKIKAKAQKK